PDQEVCMAATGTSAPCLSLFEPLRVAEPTSGSQVIAPGSRVGDSAWAKFEPVHHRALFDAAFRQPLHAERDALEAQLFVAASQDAPDWTAIAQQADAWRTRWAQQASASEFRAPGRLGAWWRKRALRELAEGNACFP
ncbi:MAG TPA: hypothetical protein PKX82_10100, partial [Rhodoferax sp.]|nr:hypothetical protein [Rhodoferax sp.]